MAQRIYDLEDRLVEFASRIIDVVENLPDTRAGNYIAGQLIRCGLAPALLYGEAQGAESPDDFVHKMKIVLKELKESRVCLKLIIKKEMIKPVNRLTGLRNECEELIKIIAKSVETAKANKTRKK
ncbi:MAG TPA: four helix bundle protein [Chitinophagaceae bacterium]|jgi:four helix bundle protein|nr:four helix bundle protein [Chitinophagaceae bacterium]HMU56750.1 four helix bundle protein [Chitinophagaceae bacterium]